MQNIYRSTVKISYSRTNFISKIIYSHNRKLTDESYMENNRTHTLHCNCKNKEEYLTGARCNSENVVKQVNIFLIENSINEKVYTGISTGNWKQRLHNHRHSFINPLLTNQITLSRWFWNLKEHGPNSQIKW